MPLANARFLKLMFGALIRAADRWRPVKPDDERCSEPAGTP
jgi:hypothetical protein